MSIVDKVYMDPDYDGSYIIFTEGVYIPFGYYSDGYVQGRVDEFTSGELEADDGWVTRGYSDEDIDNLIDISHRFDLGKNQEDKNMNMIGKAVAARHFTQEELQKVEDRLVNLGYKAYDRVEKHYATHSEEHFGVDEDGDIVFVMALLSLGEGFEVFSREEYLDIIGLKLDTRDNKPVDIRGACVRVEYFNSNELLNIQDRLEKLGVNICEGVSDRMVRSYSNGFYGVDSDNDTMFYDDASTFSDEVRVLSPNQFLEMIGLGLAIETATDGSTDTANKLYKVSVPNGNTYYFESVEAVKEVVRSEHPVQARDKLAVLVFDSHGQLIKYRNNIAEMIETKFDIEEI